MREGKRMPFFVYAQRQYESTDWVIKGGESHLNYIHKVPQSCDEQWANQKVAFPKVNILR